MTSGEILHQTADKQNTIVGHSIDIDPYFERDFVAFVKMACDGMTYDEAVADANRDVIEFRRESKLNESSSSGNEQPVFVC